MLLGKELVTRGYVAPLFAVTASDSNSRCVGGRSECVEARHEQVEGFLRFPEDWSRRVKVGQSDGRTTTCEAPLAGSSWRYVSRPRADVGAWQVDRQCCCGASDHPMVRMVVDSRRPGTAARRDETG